MIRPTTLILFVLSVISGAALFSVSFEVSALEERLVALNQEITQDRDAIHVLKAEWSYLNQPERLDGLSRRYLELQPLEGAQLSGLVALPLRDLTKDEPAPVPSEVPLANLSKPKQAFAGFFNARPKLKPKAPYRPAPQIRLAAQRTASQRPSRSADREKAALDASLRAILGNNAGGNAR